MNIRQISIDRPIGEHFRLFLSRIAVAVGVGTVISAVFITVLGTRQLIGLSPIISIAVALNTFGLLCILLATMRKFARSAITASDRKSSPVLEDSMNHGSTLRSNYDVLLASRCINQASNEMAHAVKDVENMESRLRQLIDAAAINTKQLDDVLRTFVRAQQRIVNDQRTSEFLVTRLKSLEESIRSREKWETTVMEEITKSLIEKTLENLRKVPEATELPETTKLSEATKLPEPSRFEKKPRI